MRRATPVLPMLALGLVVGLAGAMTVHDQAPAEAAGNERWERVTPAGMPPSGRQGASMIYDAKNQRMVLFGGWTGLEDSNETWSLDIGRDGTLSWAPIVPQNKPPGPRSEHTAIYDQPNQRMVVFGGWRFDSFLYGDVWSLDLTKGQETWEPMTPTGIRPDPRFAAGSVYDAANQRMVLFGGFDGDRGYADTWSLSLHGDQPAWSLVQPSGSSPSPRYAMVTAYDASAGHMIVYGGYDRWRLNYQSDTHILDLTPGSEAWRPVRSEPQPSARSHAAGAYDVDERRWLVYGGWNGNERLFDLWGFGHAADQWAQVAPMGMSPGRRRGHVMGFDPVHGRALLVGGYQGESNWLSDTWALSVRAVPTQTPSPSATPTGTLMLPTPHTPTTPDTPGTPTTPDTPGTPGTAETPTTPGTADTPSTPTETTPIEPTATPSRTHRPSVVHLPQLWNVPDPPPTATPTPPPSPTAPPCVPDDIEPNDTFGAAYDNPSLCMDVNLKGALPEGDVEDMFRIDVEHDGVIDINLWNLPPNTDHDLYLYRHADYERIGQSEAYDTQPERILAEVEAGTYYIRVLARDGHSPQRYWLRWFVP